MKRITFLLLLLAHLGFSQSMPAILDKSGNEIPMNKYKVVGYAGDTSRNSIAFVISIDNKIGFYNSYGNEVLLPSFDEFELIKKVDKTTVIKVANLVDGEIRKTGVIDLNGKMIVPQIYTSIDPMYDVPGPFQWINTSEEMQGVLLDYTKVVIPAQYREVNVVDGSQKTFFNVVDKNGDLGLLDSLGTVIVPFGLSYYDIFVDENSPSGGSVYFQLYNNKKYGYASSANGVIIAPLYKYTESLKLADKIYFPLTKGKKSGLADGEGKWVIPLEYENVEPLDINGKVYFVVKKSRKFGIANEAGKLIVPIEYGSIDSLGDGNATGLFALTDKNGQTFVLTAEHQLVKSKE